MRAACCTRNVTVCLPLRKRAPFKLQHVSVQCGVWATRCWMFHDATAIDDVAERASGVPLVLDALLWGALHALLLTSMPLGVLSAEPI